MASTNTQANTPSQGQETRPPTYAEAVDPSLKPASDRTGNPTPPSSVPRPAPQPQYQSNGFYQPPRPQHHNLYGPTPLSSSPLVPYAYYDAHSPHSLSEADSRARWRFLGAVVWGFCIWMLIGLVVGAEVEIAFRDGRLGGAGNWAKS
jgi:hypothetical protein